MSHAWWLDTVSTSAYAAIDSGKFSSWYKISFKFQGEQSILEQRIEIDNYDCVTHLRSILIQALSV